jgi:hypothetical protein
VKFRERQRAAAAIGQHTDGTFFTDTRVMERGALAEGDLVMTYRVYSGPRGSQSISPLEKDRYLFKEFSILDEALAGC